MSTGQIKIDTIYSDSTKNYEEKVTDSIVEKTTFNFKIVRTRPTFVIPKSLLKDKRMKTRAIKVMADTSKEDTVVSFIKQIENPFYKFWKGSSILGDVYTWKDRVWNIQQNKIISTSGSFENYFWLKFIGCILFMLFAGRGSYFSVIHHKESMYVHAAIQLFLSLFLTIFVFYGWSFETYNYFLTIVWFKIGLIKIITSFVGGYVVYKMYPKQILK